MGAIMVDRREKSDSIAVMLASWELCFDTSSGVRQHSNALLLSRNSTTTNWVPRQTSNSRISGIILYTLSLIGYMASLHEGSELPPVNLDVTPCPGFLLASSRTESTFDEIPVIDLKDAFSGDAEKRSELAVEIRDACVNVGFFYVKNHGVSPSTIGKTIAAAKSYFSLSEEVKMQLDIHKSTNFKGYTALLGENTDVTGNGDLHEGFDIGFEPASGSPVASPSVSNGGSMAGENVWPDGLPAFKHAALEYYHSALNLGRVLFPLFALALDMPENWFDDKTKESAAIMRLLHYPPQNATKIQEGQIGIGAHTDYECFTLLWQDKAGGLQVKNSSGKWIDAVPIPGTIVVNLGDQFARWTDDVFKSTLHRVINRSGAERYSIPLFFGTDYDVLLTPIPTCLSPGRAPQYEPIKAGDYVKSRLEATYAHSAA